MIEILDRIGQIIHPAAYLVGAPQIALDRAREKARQVLAAMRKCTHAMAVAGDARANCSNEDAQEIWQAMIDTALKAE